MTTAKAGPDASTRPPVKGLKRGISLYHATAMVVGSIIGASIFVQPSEVTGPVPSLVGAALVWIAAGVLSFFGALVVAELASTFPQTGGVYCYLREAYSPLLGFLWGWTLFWTLHSGIIAAISTVFGRYVDYFLPLGDVGIKGVGVAAVLFLSWVNYRGVKQGSNLQAAFTVVKVLAIVLIIGVGFSLGAPAETVAVVTQPPAPEAGGLALLGGGTIGDFFRALIAGLFAFGGWHMVTYNAGETFEARKTIPRALTVGVLVVTVCYVLLNSLYFYVLPLDTVINSDRVAADAADVIMGHGGTFMSALVLFSTFGALAGIILAGPRVYYAMAQDGLVFKWISEVHPKHRTPYRAIWLQAVWSSVLILTGTYRVLFTRAIYTEWIFFGLMALGLFIIRKRKDVKRSYSVWGYPFVPIIFAASAFAIVINQVISDPKESAIGFGMVLLGVPIYYFWGRKGYVRTQPAD